MLEDNGIRVRVYMEDTDAGGVVYYANYLKFMERARTEFIRSKGLDRKTVQEKGMQFVVRKLEVRYLAPAYLDDELFVQADIISKSKCAVMFKQDIARVDNKALLCKAHVQVVCVDSIGLAPYPLPAI